MQENVMQFFNPLPLFIGIAASFAFSFNEDTSIKVPILLVITSVVISFLLPIFNLKSWVTYPVIISESAMFVLIAILLSKKIKMWLAWILGWIVGFVWAIVLLILLGVTFNI
jgi:hypothetical protein